ncbi:TonB-dependent receptor [Sphingobium mellinum]|uniref:TonB-dependent receptor domain-containing protein n=1 Tax=Sphingobium mellinum TaxID=1387166 RepID=UPI0030EBF695
MGNKFLVAMLCGVSTMPVSWQAEAQTPGQAQALTQQFNIPAGNLKQALDLYRDQTDIQLIYRPQEVAKGRSAGVSGLLTREAGLRALLAGSGFQQHHDSSGAIAIIPSRTAATVATFERTALIQEGPVVPAAATEAAPEGTPDIVVTATKRSENLMNIPVAVSALSGDTLTALGVQGVQALQIATPAVVFPNTGAFSQPYIRGVGSRLNQAGFDPSVAAYVDGRYIGRQSSMNFEFADIERVEVLKGPQGVLFGRNASAGAIRIITRDVSKDFEGYVKAGYGNYNRWMLQGAVNIPISDTLGIRISGDTLHRDGFAKNIFPAGRKQWDDRNWYSVRGKIRWEPTDWFDARLTGSYWTSNDLAGTDVVQVGRLDLSTGLRLGGITGTDSKHVASALQQPNDKREYATELDLHFNLGFADLTTITTYADLNNVLGFDGDGTSAQLVDAVIFEKSKTFSHEIQLASAGKGPFEWLVGGYYFHDDTDFDTIVNRATAVPASPVASQSDENVKTKSVAVFGQLKWNITDKLSLTAGGRYTHDKKSWYAGPSGNSPVTLPGPLPFIGEKSWSKFTPSLTAEYDFGDVLTYLKFARGYKSGGPNYPANQPVVNPETLDMYEAGLKASLFNRKLRTTLSAFYYDYSDLQVSRAAAEGSAVVTTENAANAKLYGLDADMNWAVSRAFTLTGGISLLHSEYQGYLANAKVYRGLIPPGSTLAVRPAGMIDVGFNASGQSLLRAPKFSAFAGANYTVSVNGGKIPVSLSYAYKSSYLFDFIFDPPGITETGSTSALRQKGYGLVNGRIGFTPDSDRWNVSAWVNNAFDKKYFDDVAAAGTGIRASYAPPRTYGVDVQFKF